MDKKEIVDKLKLFIEEQFKELNWTDTFGRSIKGDGVDVSTDLDTQIESNFFKFSQENFPEYGIVGEEFPEKNFEKEYTWYIDPVDGTKWFDKNVPLWTVCIALVKKEEFEPEISVIYNLVSNQFYYAIKGVGAFLNGEPLVFTNNSLPEKSQIALDLTTHKLEWKWDKYESMITNELLPELYRSFYRVRSFGNGSLSLAWLAHSMFGLFISPLMHTSEYTDLAAGIGIALGAGCNYKRVSIDDKLSVLIVGSQVNIDKAVELIPYIN